jgi:response regulator RpfG family c-di-GMP phosphodiesterase
MQSQNRLRFLLVEDETDLRELLILVLTSEYPVDVFEAASGNDAIYLMERENYKFDLVISDFNMPNGNGDIVAKHLRLKSVAIPFVLITTDARSEHASVLGFPNTFYIEKPFLEEDFTTGIKKIVASPAGRQPLAKYIAVPMGVLERIANIDCPLFLKLGESHFVKIMNGKEPFTPHASERHIARGIKQLWVEAENFAPILARFSGIVKDDLYLSALRNKRFEDVKLAQTIQEVSRTACKIFGWNEQVIALGNENIKLIRNIVNFEPNLKAVFSWFEEDEHDFGLLSSILLSYTLVSLAQDMKLERKNAVECLCLAAFFHDLPLSDYLIRNQAKFLKARALGLTTNKAEVDKIIAHGNLAIEQLQDWRNCPADVIEIISQHLERPDGSGYPQGLKAADLGELVSLFIVAHELVQLYLQHRNKHTMLSCFAELSPLLGVQPTKASFDIALMQLSGA